jgi:two-component system response regulator PilR (NtrC family)
MNILIIDDNATLQQILRDILGGTGHELFSAYSGEEGLALLDEEEVDVVLLDVMLPKMSGLEALERIKEKYPSVPVIVITAYSSVESAIEAMKRGAFHYIPKPFKNEEILVNVNKALEQRRLMQANERLMEELKRRYSFSNIIGKSPAMARVFELIHLAAPSTSNILFTGESGTGKELAARAIHLNSRRAKNPFIPVNSGSMGPELLESHLFGHIKGAFTGAVANKKGLFEAAEGGSIFLDEIGNIPLDTQAKILRVIQEKEFMPLGGIATKKADVRIIAATNARLEALVEEGRFRKDLFYRLNVISIPLPPLRERKEDIPLLVEHFLRLYGQENQKARLAFKASSMRLLMDYDWPGNVRELENAVERSVVLATEEKIGPDLLPAQIKYASRPLQPGAPSTPPTLGQREFSFYKATEEFQREMILEAMDRAGGIQRRAAAILRIQPSTFNIMLKRLKIPVTPKE